MSYLCSSCDPSLLRDMKFLLWHSTAVMERIARNQVKTTSGSIYVLQGNIDSASMRKEGREMILNSCKLGRASDLWWNCCSEWLYNRGK